MNILISIIVPIYKVERYLRHCIDSLLSQDYQHIEIILVDDGSPDSCGKMVDEYAAKDERILAIHQQNAGLSAARNAGIKVAKGDYLMFVDSDDFVDTNFCSYALQKAIDTDSDIVVFGYRDIYTDRVEEQSVGKEYKFSRKEALLELHGGRLLSFAWNKIYKSSLFKTVRYPIGRLYEDIATTYLLFDKANTIYLASGITYNYLKRSDSILGKKMKAKDAIDWYLAVRQRYDFMKQNYSEIVQKTIPNVIDSTMFCLNNLCNYSGYQQQKKAMVDFLLFLKLNEDIVQFSFYQRLLFLSPHLYFFIRHIKRKLKK